MASPAARGSRSTSGRRRSPVQLVAAVSGVVFLLVGVLGFVPGITTNYDQLTLFGDMSGAMLLGVFAVSVLHNVVHLVFGLAGLAAAARPAGARSYLLVGGVIYAALWLYGLLIDQAGPANFVPVNTADNWLHLALAVVMILAGLALGHRRAPASADRA